MVYIKYIGYVCACGAWHCETQGVAYSFECHYCIERAMWIMMKVVA